MKNTGKYNVYHGVVAVGRWVLFAIVAFLIVGLTLVCKLCLNGMPVPLLRNGYSIFNGTKYR